MRVQLLMRDAEYRNALTEMISVEDRDIFVEVSSTAAKDGKSLILTDIDPKEIDSEILAKISRRTLFLSPVDPERVRSSAAAGNEVKLHVIFKYCCLSSIMAELAILYHEWTGDIGGVSTMTRTIAVTGESDLLSSERCRSIARQIIYLNGGSVLILPLGFINDYSTDTEESQGWFSRLMYLIDEGRDYPAESFISKDSYGISYLMLPQGLNPVAGIGGEYLRKLISSIGFRFDTLILDIGTCFRKENIEIAAHADDILFIGNGRRIPDISRIIGSEASSKVRRIRINSDEDETLAIDECLRAMYT